MEDYEVIMIGETFGRLTVIDSLESRPYGKSGKRRKYWLCECVCGNTKECHTTQLRAGWTKSCGCLHIEKATERVQTHGLSNNPAYNSWCGMKARCTNPKEKSFPEYGGRGITFDPNWSTFEGFWSDMGETWVEGSTLERKNCQLGYNSSNCEWIPAGDQSKNRRSNIWIMVDGDRMYLKQFCEAYGYPYNRVKDRINGKRVRWSLEDALFTEKKPGGKGKKVVPPFWGDTVYQIDYEGNKL